MAEMARVGTGSSWEEELGVPEESDAILGGGGGDGQRRQATRWELAEARLNQTVSAYMRINLIVITNVHLSSVGGWVLYS